MALTVKGLAKLTAPGRYGDGHGLYLQVGKGTGRAWLLRYTVRGKERWMGLGPLHEFRLDEARDRARRARQQLRDGIDPLEAKAATRDAQALADAKRITFKDATQQYFDQHKKNGPTRATASNSSQRWRLTSTP